MRGFAWGILFGLGTVTASAPYPAHAAGCADIETGVRQAYEAATPERAVALLKQAEGKTVCSGEVLALIGRNTAYSFYRKAYSGAVSDAERERLLREGRTYGRPWQLLAALADIEKAKGTDAARIEAGQLYQEALEDIVNEKLNLESPPAATIGKLHRRAQEMRLLAKVYVVRPTRSSCSDGLGRHKFRSFTAVTTAVPIHFEYDKTEFTAEGRKAAEDMHCYLTEQGMPAIDLVGHTDPRGTNARNKVLSEGRAAAVKAFLVAKGYTGIVRTSGKGPTEPFQSDDPGSYSQEERWQFDRRVELRRN